MSLVLEFGCPEPHEVIDGEPVPLPGPNVVRFVIDPIVKEDGSLHPAYIIGTDAVEMLRHFAQNPGPVKHLGGNELVQDAIGLWERHSASAPSWVRVVQWEPYSQEVADDLERFISEYWGCSRGAPSDLEQTHYTQYGSQVFAPGEAPAPAEGE